MDWRGQEVFRQVMEAARKGIDATTADCVNEAKENVPVVTGTLQGSIRIEPATIDGPTAKGRWGSFDVNYALAVETGDRGLLGPDGTEQVVRPIPGRGRNRGNRNFLRSAADNHYPMLNRNIQEYINL